MGRSGRFPRELYKKAAAVGYMGLGFPEAYGGTEGDRFMRIIAMQEIARAGCGGVGAGLFSHTIGAPPILHRGPETMKARVLPQILSGEKISALAITEPSRRLRRREPPHHGEARRRPLCRQRLQDLHHLGHARRLHHARSPHRRPGHERRQPDPDRGRAQGLAAHAAEEDGLVVLGHRDALFRRLRVPVENLIGKEGDGFRAIMLNFNDERLHGAAGAISAARVCLDEAVAYAKQRVTFGKPIIQHQVIRHKLVDMAMKIEASQAMLEMLTWRLEQGENPVAEVCMLKNQATTTLAFCASEGVQIFGGAGFMRGVKVERIYREVKVNAIGAGTEEIMKDLASRQMGL